ncbi:ABC transporter permease [Falsarthrobacter nasiphocae]|uniref:ABC transport system permease protein n=1 Tax=Falsarthrobacter nasiphocae TaxID=189863 RepID=A0AAE3YHH3_9MICC|nr:ABC transporter permease [Falsarthrobacter nasiphocae]MDR6892106.1 putative ABC transport system permease protein [Falsarthrobacter nasiphocae]
MLLREAWRNVTRRWNRTAFSLLTIVIGAATLVTMLAVTRGSAYRSAEHLAALSSGMLTVSLPAGPAGWAEGEEGLRQRLLRQPGVKEAGTFTVLNDGQRTPVSTARTRDADAVSVALSDSGLRVMGGHVVAGGWPSAGSHEMLVGQRVAETLGVAPELGQNQVKIGDRWWSVVGVVQGTGNAAILNEAVIFPPTKAASLEPTVSRNIVLEASVPDAVPEEQLRLAAWPYEPEHARITRPVSAESLSTGLLRESETMVLVTMLVLAVSAVFSVYSTMQTAVWERRRHIGLDRALGASRGRIAGLFLFESALTGGLGGLAGTGLGVLVGAGVAALQGWPHLLPWWVVVVPGAGAVIGAISGLLPAVGASRVDPAQLLRE